MDPKKSQKETTQEKDTDAFVHGTFKRVMEWGTPRIVSKTRKLSMGTKQMESRSLLLSISGVKDLNRDGDKTKTGFNIDSVKNFRKRMLEEEMQSESDVMHHQDLTKRQV